MDQIVLDATSNTTIRVESVSGNLRVSGWDQLQFTADADGDESLHVGKNGDTIVVRADCDCSLRMPLEAALFLNSVSGDVKVRNLEGQLTIQSVSGDLTLRQVGPVDIESVASDVSAKKVEGHLRARAVGGDLLARNIEGDFAAQSVSGDLYLRDVDGSVQAEVSGDVTLSLEFAAGQNYSITASGDVDVRLGADANGRFEIQSSSDINIDVSGAQVEGQAHQRTVRLGTGEPLVRLQASGDVVLSGRSLNPEAWGEFGDRFGEDIGVMAEEMAAHFTSRDELNRILNERLANLNINAHIRTDEIAAKARRAAEKVRQAQERAERERERAQRHVQAAQERAQRERERAQRHVEAAQRRAEAMARRAEARSTERGRRGAWAFGFTTPPRPPVPPVPPVPPAEPISDDERMMILRMVEQGKITVEDAEKLLSALEGK